MSGDQPHSASAYGPGLGSGDPLSVPIRHPGATRVRLRTLVLLRWLAVVGQTAAVVTVHFGLGFPIPLAEAGAVIGALVLFNVWASLRFPLTHELTEREAALALAYDLVQLGVLLYLTGGLLNPFALLIIVPVTISAAILGLRSTISLGALGVGTVTLLAVYHRPLPWPAFTDDGLGAGLAGVADGIFAMPVLYIAGLWWAVVIGLAFIAAYVWRVAEETRRTSDALAATHLALAHAQRLSALGALAAAAAHELGTPLGTIQLVAKELARDLPAEGPQADDVSLLLSQAERCRDILARLSEPREEFEASPFSRMPFHLVVNAAAEPHRGLGAEIRLEAGGEGPEPLVTRRPGIIHGIGNLIENAVGFASSEVHLACAWTEDECRLEIEDDGPGFAPDILLRLGEPYVSGRGSRSQEGGLGLGVFIAKTLLEQTGAAVSFSNRGAATARRGARVRIVWPRARLEAGDDAAGFPGATAA